MTTPKKPRVHWVSPLPTAQTDIAHYTRRILPELARKTELILWTDANDWDRTLYDFAPVRRLSPDHVTPRDFARANRAGQPGTTPEAVFVNIGNAWPFHAGFLRMIQRIPSVVVLHDMAIQEMCFDAMDRGLFPRDTYEASMERWHGKPGIHAAHAVFDGDHTRAAIAQEYPGYELALQHAVSVLTHTPVARDAVEATHDLPVYLRDLPFRASAAVPDYIRSRVGGLRLVQFGYSGPNRRLQNVLEALAPLRDEIDFHLDIFGSVWDPGYIQNRAEELGLSHHVQQHGFVAEAELNAALARAHLAFNLRNPTMGEASGSQLRIWDAGVPAVVTDLGWYADLPEDTVFKIDPHQEVPALQDLIRRMDADPTLGRAVAVKGRAQLEAVHGPGRYAGHVAEVAERFSADAAAMLRQGRVRPALSEGLAQV